MSYGNKFILGFSNDLGELYEIYFDFLGYTGMSSQITGSGDVLTLRSTGGDEDKLQPLLGTEALIDIFVDQDTDLTIGDLVAQHDNDIRVTVYKDKNYVDSIFQGFIVVEDNSQPFQDPPFTLSVRALDGIGLLKGVDLVDTTGVLFAGSYSILAWVCQILYKTDQTMNLRVFFNIFEQSMAMNVNPLEQMFLSANTFSTGDSFNVNSTDPSIDLAAQAADDCYTALEKIVRCLRCRLFQENGRWNLVSLYEYLNPAGYSYTEYSLGDPVAGIVPFTSVDSAKSQLFDVQAGKNGIIHPIQDDQILYLKIATKWIQLNYSYDQSQNKVCNQDLSDTSPATRQPADDEMIQSQVIDPTLNPSNPTLLLTTQAYQAYCYDLFDSTKPPGSSNYNPYPSTVSLGKGFIRVVLDRLGFEYSRFLVIKPNTGGKFPFLRTSRVLIDTGDIFQITFQWRTRNALTSGLVYFVANVHLYGDDGTYWSLHSANNGDNSSVNPVAWVQDVNSNFEDSSGVDLSVTTAILSATNQWIEVDANTAPAPGVAYAAAPISGTIEVIFVYCSNTADEMWVKDINITILPFLQGSYQQLKGDYNFSGSNNNIKQTENDTVEISDSPKRYFKGALLKANNDLISTSWARAGVTESKRFTQLMEQIMFTHLGRMLYKIEGTWKGLVYRPTNNIGDDRPNGYLNSWLFLDSTIPTKKYMLTSFEKNIGTGQWRGVFVETLNDQNDPGLAQPDNYTFSYLFK